MPFPIMYSPGGAKCPKCGKHEKIVRKCEHCGYEYSVKASNLELLLIMGLFITIVILISLMLSSCTAKYVAHYDDEQYANTYIQQEYIYEQGWVTQLWVQCKNGAYLEKTWNSDNPKDDYKKAERHKKKLRRVQCD